MKKIALTIILISSLVFISACNKKTEETKNADTPSLIQECPEQLILNKMPRIIEEGEDLNQEDKYYILNGERREISEFDEEWVKEKCDVEEVEVF